MSCSFAPSPHKHLFSTCHGGSESVFLGSDPSGAHFSCGFERWFDPEPQPRGLAEEGGTWGRGNGGQCWPGQLGARRPERPSLGAQGAD